ncbi:carboxylesterase family protein [Bradyrhizobium jicamae]|uniref:Carboxylic ester hydrolase n=1 Tax=Bradyrhizobium jicamae TaxID=280332 RepID=A0ABS5FX65_9BRAD|nr:carboxylesterase family protein [Bradyrhizobium jicamae]MBR0801310.1 carboxylesterase family protein [Bradyrhizobium jicamae]MBR0931748.1 carboxylesterase family protein [Bradyrhizobium jicamae]
MRRPCWFLAFATGALLMFGSNLHAQLGERFVFALTQEGQVLGMADSDIAKFMGIPYAAPPIGAARWRAPAKAAQREEIFTASKFGPSCPQAPGQTFEAPARNSEDCLTINVFTPARMDERLPVMVWIHGGGLSSGTAADPLYDGSALARAGLTVVTFNYRLGALGWLASGILSKDEEDDGIGNYGMKDQIAALRWVHDNISAFGGDPDNVTIFGSSSGANAVAMLMASRRATGLFQKAIIQSASFRDLARDRNTAESAAQAFAQALGTRQVEMRQSELQKIVAVQEKQAEDPGLRPAYTIDGTYVDEQLQEAIAAGHEQHIPLLIGSNGFPYSPNARSMPGALLQKLLQMTSGLHPDFSGKDAPARIRTDWVFSEPTRFVARTHAGHGSTTYRYLFDYVSERAEPPEEGEDGQEIRFVFGTLAVRSGLYSHRDREISNTMLTYWTNFAKYGDPNGSGVPVWRPQSVRDDLLMISNSGVICGPDPMKERLDLIEHLDSRP